MNKIKHCPICTQDFTVGRPKSGQNESVNPCETPGCEVVVGCMNNATRGKLKMWVDNDPKDQLRDGRYVNTLRK